MSAIERIWYGSDMLARAARTALAPASWVFRAGVAVRARGFARARSTAALPALSVGNLTVGGTGKTPLAAWAAAALVARGARPAIIMRGYGNDEPLVHAALNPGVRVVVDPDRARGMERALADGADCAILDDAFQHRRAARTADWVLVSAEQWRDDLEMLPAGPLREPVSALSRADAIIVTRKSASCDEADKIGNQLGAQFPSAGIAVCHLALDAVVDAHTNARVALSTLAGKRLVAVAAIGNPQAFFAQLRTVGARIDVRPFRDHHLFEAKDILRLAADAERCDGLVCTLKDAVKLAPLWPPASAPLLYVSQIAVIERGELVLGHGLEMVLAARQAVTSTAGSAGPSSPPHGHRSSTAD
ncbi:MAG: Tetraacyldisaccharide 4-kinase [Gemmatimonadetes bacterium]|nr:Tetraacyldisaccharide 4-kinase [Gemmatimonadota bacterium]